LQCPSKALVPSHGETCGRREREADTSREWSDPFTRRRRYGGRHPDPRDVGSLRGLSEQRGSWSVRLVRAGLVPARMTAPTTTGALWTPRRGTSSVCAKRMHSSWRRPKSALHARGHVLRSVQRPVLVMLLPSRVGARPFRYRGRANLRKAGGTGTGVGKDGRSAARRVSPLLLVRRSCVTRQKRKEVMASVPARKRELGFGCSYVGMQLQKSPGNAWPRILSSMELQKEPPAE